MARLKKKWKILGAIVIVIVAPIAWWLLSPLFIDRTVEEEFLKAGTASAVRKIRTGAFRDGDSFHKGSGQVAIHRLGDGSAVLRMEDFKGTNGPDLHVYLASHPNPQEKSDVVDGGFVNLGRLKGNIGSQNYPIAKDVDISKQKSVVIWCKAFSVIFSVASLK